MPPSLKSLLFTPTALLASLTPRSASLWTLLASLTPRSASPRTLLASRAAMLALAALLAFTVRPAQALEASEDIDTNRPSFMFSPIVVPKGSLQVESGALFQKFRHGNWYVDAPETQLRLGITKTTELQVFVPQWVMVNSAPNTLSGGTDIQELGIKQQLRRNPGRFNASAVAGITLPTGNQNLSGQGVQAAFRLPYGLALDSKWSLCGMQSVVLVNGARNVSWQPDVLVCRTLGKRAVGFIEYAGFFTHKVPQINIIHFGTVYKTTKNQQIDAHCGFGMNETAPAYFFGAGYSFRFDHLF